MRKWLPLIVVMHPAFAAPGADTEEADLKRRVQQLEQQTKALQKNQESLTKTIKEAERAQDSALDLEKNLHSKLQASGYADVEFRSASGDDSHPGFRIHHFSLILTKQINEHWRTFAEIEYEDAPRVAFEPGSQNCQGECSGEIFLEAMNVDYSPGDHFGVQVGRFFTPAGIWSIDHYPPFVATQERPLHIREIFPQLIDGAQLHGTVPMSDVFLAYEVYAGNGEGSSASGDNNDDKSLGARATFQLPWFTQFELGASVYTDTLGGDSQTETSKIASGFHARVRGGRIAFQSELATARYAPEEGTEYTTAGYYAQIGIDISTATIGYRHDVFEDYETVSDSSVDTTRNSLFANYRVFKNVVLKLEHHVTARDGADDATLTVASVAVYLGD